MKLNRIDHVVLTVRDIAATCEFYTRVLGMRAETCGPGRTALHFGTQKINLHQAGHEFEPKSAIPTPGSADICLVTTGPIEDALAQLAADDVAIEEGPVARTGALGPMTSIYFRDPDGNLIEVASYLPPDRPRSPTSSVQRTSLTPSSTPTSWIASTRCRMTWALSRNAT